MNAARARGRAGRSLRPGVDVAWTRAPSAVERALFLDDYLYSASDAAVKVNRVDDLAADVASVDVSKARAAAAAP